MSNLGRLDQQNSQLRIDPNNIIGPPVIGYCWSRASYLLPSYQMETPTEIIGNETHSETTMARLAKRIEVIESTVMEIRELLANPEPQKDRYTVAEVAQKLSRADFTVREWARLGRVYASKRACGRGPTQEWIISAEEVERIQNEGLLPN